jgi:hypothetical protein
MSRGRVLGAGLWVRACDRCTGWLDTPDLSAIVLEVFAWTFGVEHALLNAPERSLPARPVLGARELALAAELEHLLHGRERDDARVLVVDDRLTDDKRMLAGRDDDCFGIGFAAGDVYTNRFGGLWSRIGDNNPKMLGCRAFLGQQKGVAALKGKNLLDKSTQWPILLIVTAYEVAVAIGDLATRQINGEISESERDAASTELLVQASWNYRMRISRTSNATCL